MTARIPVDHHVPIGGDWVLWKWVCVRGAGFPAVEVLRLAAPHASAAADRLLDAEDRFELLRESAIAKCRTISTGRARSAALKPLFRGDIPPPTADAAIDALLVELTTARGERDTARRVLEQALSAEHRTVGVALREIAQSPRFQEAVLLQNRTALSHVVRGLTKAPAGTANAETRQREAFVARYLQRYAVKNDSISFFGPVGWGAIAPTGPAVDAQPGPTLLARRFLFFEYWCIDALADVLSMDERIRPQIAPRRMPAVRVEGNVLHQGFGRSTAIPEMFAALLTACDGVRSAKAIAEELCTDSSHELDGVEDVYEMLRDLAEKKLLTWSFEIQSSDYHPEAVLRAHLEHLESGEARSLALEKLDELEAARDTVAKAAGDPVALEHALVANDETFTRLTGIPATRKAGQTYAARTLLLEDCLRDVHLSLGPETIAALAPPLTLLLQGARWFMFELSRVYTDILEQNWTRLSSSLGEEIEYTTFIAEIVDLLSATWLETAPKPVREVSERLWSRWAELLQIAPSQRRVELSSADLRSWSDKLFAAPHGGFPSARFHSPDVIISAKSVEDIARGDFQLVLGEMHVAQNTVAAQSMLVLHPDMTPLVAAMEHDSLLPMVATVGVKERITHVISHSQVPRDFEVETGTARSSRPRDRVLVLGELVVTRHQGKLVVRTRDGRASFDILAFIENLTNNVGHFRVLPRAKHSPRVTIDKLVVNRESWMFTPEELAFAHLPTALERFAGARRWARSTGVPRFAFYRTPEEIKPMFVDFDSPTYVEILAHQLRSATAFSISEMLPAIDDCWLPDHDGNRYTCELRMAAFDLAPLDPWFEGQGPQ